MAGHEEDRTIALTAFIGRPVEEVATLLATRPASVITGGRSANLHHMVVTLQVPIGQHADVRRTAVVALKPHERGGERVRLPLSITALDSERWFPTFSGALEADEAGHGETRLQMKGTYTLPLGPIGRASGSIGGDRAAHASLFAFFLGIAAAAERELGRAAPSWRPAPLPESLRDDHSPIGA